MRTAHGSRSNPWPGRLGGEQGGGYGGGQATVRGAGGDFSGDQRQDRRRGAERALRAAFGLVGFLPLPFAEMNQCLFSPDGFKGNWSLLLSFFLSFFFFWGLRQMEA